MPTMPMMNAAPLKVWLAGQIVRLGMRRLAAQAARAAQRGELDRTALAEQLQSYAHISDIWRHPQINKLAQEQKKYV